MSEITPQDLRELLELGFSDDWHGTEKLKPYLAAFDELVEKAAKGELYEIIENLLETGNGRVTLSKLDVEGYKVLYSLTNRKGKTLAEAIKAAPTAK